MNKDYLVLVDMQNDFLGGCLSADNYKRVIDNTTTLFEEFQFDSIICTLDTHRENYLDTREGKHLPVKHCIKDTDGHKLVKPIYDSLYSQPHVEYIEKNSFAPDQTALFRVFRDFDKGDKIFVCGVCTDICVISTALQLMNMFQETEIYLIEPCCAGTDAENHEHALRVMESCQINIIDDFVILKANHPRLKLLKLNY